MPVTARLSRRFYDVLGEDVANELVDWFNAVDLTYRNDLRELNELNFARFDAKVEQRFAESEARLERRLNQLQAAGERRFNQLEARLAGEADQFGFHRRPEILQRRRHAVTGFERLEEAIERSHSDLLRWMFALWLTSAGATILTRLL